MSPNSDEGSLPDAGASTSANEVGAEAAALSRTGTVSIRWEAPLPPPALLEQYDQVVPGRARDIARQAQVEASHVRQRDQEALKAAVQYHARGQWMGFIAVLGIIGLAARALWMDSKWVAGIATSIVVGTAAVFVLGTLRKKGKEERE